MHLFTSVVVGWGAYHCYVPTCSNDKPVDRLAKPTGVTNTPESPSFGAIHKHRHLLGAAQMQQLGQQYSQRLADSPSTPGLSTSEWMLSPQTKQNSLVFQWSSWLRHAAVAGSTGVSQSAQSPGNRREPAHRWCVQIERRGRHVSARLAQAELHVVAPFETRPTCGTSKYIQYTIDYTIYFLEPSRTQT